MTEPTFTALPFVVIVDTREQAPFEFKNIEQMKSRGGGILIVPVKRTALTTGDYSIEGMESDIAVERKELGDFYNCCGQDRVRFEKQLSRLNEMKFGCMMVEADWLTVSRGHRESKLNPDSVIGSVISWQMEHYPNVKWWFCGSKRFAEKATLRILERWWRKSQ